MVQCILLYRVCHDISSSVVKLSFWHSTMRFTGNNSINSMADPGWGIWGKCPPPLQEIAYKIEIL